MERPTVCCVCIVLLCSEYGHLLGGLRSSFLLPWYAGIVLLSNFCCCHCCNFHTNFVVIATIVSHLICMRFKRLRFVLNQCPYLNTKPTQRFNKTSTQSGSTVRIRNNFSESSYFTQLNAYCSLELCNVLNGQFVVYGGYAT